MSWRDCVCASGTLTPQQKWRKLYGTESYGNLPQDKKSQHVGHMWNPCPYSSSVPEAYTRGELGLSPTDPLPVRNDHIANGKEHFMDEDYRGGWGYECTYNNCPHLIQFGTRYFYK